MTVWRINNPCRSAYNNLRSSANRRKLPFELTYAEFERVSEATGYTDGKGMFRHNYHMDRIDPAGGYSVSNIQVITSSDHAVKTNEDNKARRAGYVATKLATYSEPEPETEDNTEYDPF